MHDTFERALVPRYWYSSSIVISPQYYVAGKVLRPLSVNCIVLILLSVASVCLVHHTFCLHSVFCVPWILTCTTNAVTQLYLLPHTHSSSPVVTCCHSMAVMITMSSIWIPCSESSYLRNFPAYLLMLLSPLEQGRWGLLYTSLGRIHRSVSMSSYGESAACKITLDEINSESHGCSLGSCDMLKQWNINKHVRSQP